MTAAIIENIEAIAGNNIRITFDSNHVFETDDIVTISDVGGFEEIFDGGDDIRIEAQNPTQIRLVNFPASALGSDTYQPTGTIDRASKTISIRNIIKDTDDTSNPLTVQTREPHGLVTGDTVMFADIIGTTQLNGQDFSITRVNDDTFTVDSTDSTSSYGDFQTAGEADIPAVNVDIKHIELVDGEPVRIRTDNVHKLVDGNTVIITNVGGTTELNDNTYTITVTDNDEISLNDTDGSDFTAYVGRGVVTREGDEFKGNVAALRFQTG